MRQITRSSEPIKDRECIIIGKTADCFVRTNITSETVTDEEGNERTEYSAVEYFARLNAHKNFTLTDDVCDKIIAYDTAKEAERIRKMRNDLLDASDKEILPDRLNKSSSAFKAWSDYREALRDIPEQEGFPWEVEWPERP